jgi:hypothetical protein
LIGTAPARRLATLVLVLASGSAACRRSAPVDPATVAPVVSPELRAVVGRLLEIDASRIDPDLSLVSIKPSISDVEVVWLTLGLEQAFNVDIKSDASFEIIGARAHEAPLKLTLRNIARMVASAPHAEHPPAPADAAQEEQKEAISQHPTLVRGAYVFECPIGTLESARVRVDRKSRLALISGRRTLDTVALEGDFFGADAVVECLRGYVMIRRKQGNGLERAVTYAWRQGHLDLNQKANEVPGP